MYLRINMPTAGCILIGTKSADKKYSRISECAKQRRQSWKKGGGKGLGFLRISSVKNAPLREAEELRYLWRQLNSQEHMILTRRASRGGTKSTWEGARLDAIVHTSRSLVAVNLFPFILYEWRSGLIILYERQPLVSVVPAFFLNSREARDIYDVFRDSRQYALNCEL